MGTNSSPPPNEQPAAGADSEVITASGFQQVLYALANLGAEPDEQATVARVQRTQTDYAMVTRRRSKRGRTTRAETARPEEENALDALASASDDLRSAARRVREQFLRLAGIEIRKVMDMELGDAPVEEAPPHAPDPPQERTQVVTTAEAPAAAEQDPSSDELYEGTVRLLVMADGNVQRIVEFVDELCQMPQFRMLRMTGSHQQEGAEISLGLREPLPFLRILSSMRNVASVEETGPDAAEQVRGVTVQLLPSDTDHEPVSPELAGPGETEG